MVIIEYVYTPSLIEYDSYMIPSSFYNEASLELDQLEIDIQIKSINLDDLKEKRLLIDMKTNQIQIEPIKKTKPKYEKKSIQLIEVSHDEGLTKKSIRIYKTKSKTYFCALDVLYPVIRHKENISREINYRLLDTEYKLIYKRYFITYNGLKNIIKYRMTNRKKLSMIDDIKCRELLDQLKNI